MSAFLYIWLLAALEAPKTLKNFKELKDTCMKSAGSEACFCDGLRAKAPAWEHFSPLLSLQTEGIKTD